VTGLGATQAEARSHAYEACARIAFEGMQLRTDIAAQIDRRLNQRLHQRLQMNNVEEI
jgi:phosphoribosylamine-glycine ligase